MDSKKIKALLMAGVTLFVSGCSAVTKNSYTGYMKNVSKCGMGVTKQFDNAIQNGNIEWLEEILTAYPDFDVNYCGNIMQEYLQSGSYIHETIMVVTARGMGGDIDVLKYLMGKGLDINIGINTKSNRNILTLASDGRSTRLFDILMENDADVNSGSGVALLNASKDSLDKTKKLLEKGMKPTSEIFENISYDIGEEPRSLQYILKYYLENVGEPDLSKAEQYAILGEDELLIEELKKDKPLDNPKIIRDLILCLGKPETMRVFSELYPDYACVYSDMLSKMYISDNPEMVRYCIENDLVRTDGLGTSVIAHYVYENDIEMCNKVIEKGVYTENDKGAEVLSAALACNNMDTFMYAVDKVDEIFGLDEFSFINVNKWVEWSEFTKAAFDYLREKYGLTMQCIPLSILDVKTAEYLYNNGREIFPTDLQRAIYKNDVEMVKLVLEKGANPNQCLYNDFDFTLSDGSYKYDTTYEEFIEAHESGNDEWKQFCGSCIGVAISHASPEIVQLMVDNGLNMDNKYLMWNAVYDSSKATFDILYNAGASLEYNSNDDQQTLVDLAKEYGREDIENTLREAGVSEYGGPEIFGYKLIDYFR